MPQRTERKSSGKPRKLENVLKAKARRIALALGRSLGTPKQAANLAAPLDMLIATVLSQNTNDRNSHRAYTNLRKRYPRWDDVAQAPVRSLVATIRSGGMANQKAARIREILRRVKAEYGEYDLAPLAKMPDDEVIARLTAMNGVGKKTAACVLVFSLGRDVFPVDTHVHRICGRLGLTPGCRTPEHTFEAMKNLFPRGQGYSFHTNLIRFGRKTCRSQHPACGTCPVYKECEFEPKAVEARRNAVPSARDHSFMLLDNVTA